MIECLYKKVGKRYKPVENYYDESTLPAGYHLICIEPGLRSTKYRINPDHATLLAAMRTAEKAMIEAMTEANRLRVDIDREKPLTGKVKKAWEEFARLSKKSAVWCKGVTMYDIVEAGMKAVMEQVAVNELAKALSCGNNGQGVLAVEPLDAIKLTGKETLSGIEKLRKWPEKHC